MKAGPEGAFMEMAKPTEADKEQFKSLMAGLPGIDIKPLFGNLGGYVGLPVQGPADDVEPWVARALAHVATLPPKAPKPPKSPKVPKAPRSPKGP
jgi:hypothetical protein